MENKLENQLRDALAEEPPVAADMRIVAAIRAERTRRTWAISAWRWAAAASVAILIGTGIWWNGRLREEKLQEDGELMLQEDSELMLAIIGMADIDDFTPIRDALL